MIALIGLFEVRAEIRKVSVFAETHFKLYTSSCVLHVMWLNFNAVQWIFNIAVARLSTK